MTDHWDTMEDALTAHRKYVNATHPTFDAVRHEKVLDIDAALAFVREQRQLAAHPDNVCRCSCAPCSYCDCKLEAA
jgi:hypothetical protein